MVVFNDITDILCNFLDANYGTTNRKLWFETDTLWSLQDRSSTESNITICFRIYLNNAQSHWPEKSQISNSSTVHFVHSFFFFFYLNYPFSDVTGISWRPWASIFPIAAFNDSESLNVGDDFRCRDSTFRSDHLHKWR